ncbi:MAG: hypothetical protein JWR75_1954 [Devosia sp.]|nr:hypothetical protein [Devosia sp.]
MNPELVVAAAKLWLGTPYRHQASALGLGCDCLGLVRGVWRAVLGAEPETPPPYAASIRDGRNLGSLEAMAKRHLIGAGGAPRLGQVVLFRLRRAVAPRHCGIVSGPGRFIHAQEGLGVVEAALGEAWLGRVAGIYEFPGGIG